jgi:predicted HTH transcriptional regulator
MTLKKYRTQQSTAEELHEILKKNTKTDQILSTKNIREIIGYKKTQTHQFIQILIKMNKLEQVGGHRNIGFLYKLK